MVSNIIIQSFWVGDTLSHMEQLCIKSFLDANHKFHLFTYSEVENIPSGTVVLNAEEIVPKSALQKHKNGSWAIFADYFRYKLLYERGGWWVDMDTVCLQPFEFNEDYVFSSEKGLDGKAYINNTIIKCPIHSKVMEGCLSNFNLKEIRQVQWGHSGPKLIAEHIINCNLESYVKEHEVFCPIPYIDMSQFIKPVSLELSEESYCIHFWNELWRRKQIDKNSIYDEQSIYEKLKRKHLPGYREVFTSDYSDLTVIIPFRLDSEDCRSSLNLMLSSIPKHINAHIIVLEVDEDSKISIEESSIQFSHVFILDSTPVLHKTKYLNRIIRKVKTPYIAVWDLGVIIDPNQIEKSIYLLRSSIADLVIPYDGRIFSVNHVIRKSVANNWNIRFLTESIDRMELITGNHSVGGAFFVNKSTYVSAGMENEDILGLGFEDIERVKRFEILGHKVKWIEGVLFHINQSKLPKSLYALNCVEMNNRKEYLRICHMKSNDLLQEVLRWGENR